MAKCEICGCTDFYKNSGYLYCESCQTQQNVEDVDMELSMGARLQKKKLPKQNLKQAENGWTSWELYNFVMIGLSNELIELGAPSSIKLTILQLWTRYLGKLEVAFVSTKKKVLPKFSRKYKKKDAEIIYGKMLSQNKSRKSRKTANDAMSFVASNCQDNEEINEKKLNKTKNLMMTAEYDKCAESQTNLEKYDMTYSESMHSFQSNSTRFSQRSRIQFNAFAKEEIKKVKNKAKSLPKHERTKYKESFISNEYQSGPKLITPLKLWAILYLALRIHDQDIHLGDMIRFAREGHLSYYRLDYLIPSEITLARSEAFLLSRVSNITHTGLRKIIGKMAEFLGVNIICPDLLSFITRYCTELHLPRGISLYAERLMALFPPKMKYESNKKFLIPNYEGRAMAFIIVVMKMLLGLDGITEYEISKVAAKINSAIDNENISDLKLFNFWEWQNYIECRKAVLVNAHYPTKLKYNSNIPDVKSLYIKFLDFIKSKTDRSTPEMMTCNYKRLIPEEYAQIMAHCINNINDTNSHELNNELNEFSPSLTPHHSYLQELLNHPLWDLPSILRNDFTSTKIRYMTKPDFICTLSMQYDMSLNIIDSNLHFLEKTVPFFEIIKMAEIKELTDDIEVQESSLEEQIKMTEEKESFIEYMHKKMSCQIKIDTKKKQYYNTICNRITNTKTSPPTSSNSEFIFNEVLPNGKLSIPSNKIDDDDDDENDDTCIKDTVRKAELSKFCKAYDIHLSSTEKEVLLTNKRLARKKKRILLRKNGKFVKYNNGDSRCKSDSPSEDEDSDKEIEAVLENDLKIDNISPKNNTVSDLSKNNTIYEHGDQSRRRRKTFKKTDNSAFEPDANDNIVKHNNLYRPFTDYWVYHCNFGQINSKSFKLFEKMLPRSFRWLLKECANVLEMPMEDLYEEVCTVEAYCIHMSEQCNTDGKRDKYPNICTILKKW